MMKLMDRAMYLTESDASPKHVAGLLKFSLPKGKDYQFVLDTYEHYKTFDEVVSPFNKTVSSLLNIPLYYKTAENIDMDYHLQIHEIEDVEDLDELNALTIRLHKEMLDRSKPLWQSHLIYSKKGNTFAVYNKIHHIYSDGITILSWLVRSLSNDDTVKSKPFWSIPRIAHKAPFSYKKPLEKLFGLVIYIKDVIILLFNNLVRTISPSRTDNAVPFSGKRTVLTGKVTAGRVMATLDLPLDKMSRACKLSRTTINDFMLTVIDIAVHRFLKDYGHDDFDRPLIAQMPVSLRRPGDNASGNKIAIALVRLAHGRTDPYKRMRQIVNSNFLVKQEVKVYSPAVYTHISLMYQSIALLIEKLGLSEHLRPLGNILVSNVPGPKVPLYLEGAKLKGIYPVSTITPCGGVNVTLVSSNGKLAIGLLACDHKVKSLKPLVEYMEDSFELLIKSIEDPTVTIDDLGERSRNENLTIVEDSVSIVTEKD